MSINNNQPNHQPQVNRSQGFTFEQKIVLLSLALVAAMVLVAFVTVLQFYQPQPQIQYVVVTATPGLLLPTADMAQNQVSNLDEPTATPTITSVMSQEQFETRVANDNVTNEAWQWLIVTAWAKDDLTPMATDWPELATAKVQKQGTLSIDEHALLNRTYFGGKRERGQTKANELGQCVRDDEDVFTYYCPGYNLCSYACSELSDPFNPMMKEACPNGEGDYLSCYDETLGHYVAVPLPPE